jgi:Dolichyl-phosphate-mannose-protein mannosyltransferase
VTRRPSRSSWLVVLAVVWACSAAYLLQFVDHGWIPHDDGALAHSAERVLHGELPHRDFDEIYTGGLSQLYALAFRMFGVALTTIRRVVLVVALLFVPALYAIATRFVPPLVAGLLTLIAVAWSVPNYFAGVPSWYNLFFATFGTLALLRHVESGTRRWLVLAGICGGLSLLAKITGVYFVAAALLFLLYREHWLAVAAAERAGSRAGSRMLVAIELGGGLIAAAGIVAATRARLQPMEVGHFLLPAAALLALVIWTEAAGGTGSIGARARGVAGLVGPFLAGVAVPVGLFLIPYVASGATSDLLRGLFVLPARRIEAASFPLPPPSTLLFALPYALVLLWSPTLPLAVELAITAATVAGLAVVLAMAGSRLDYYEPVWWAVRPLVPVVTVIGCLRLLRAPPATPSDAAAAQRLFLVLAVASLVSVVQFPYAFPVYFFYAAPLVVVAVAAVVAARPGPRILHFAVAGFALAFALLWLNTAYVRSFGLRYIADQQHYRLDLDRGGLTVWEDRKVEYERLVQLLRQHARTPWVYAAPDAPEVYFLSGLGNPTRTIFDVFDERDGRVERILQAIDAKGVTVVAIFQKPEFSPHLDPALADGLGKRFPRWTTVGRFQVGWRD